MVKSIARTCTVVEKLRWGVFPYVQLKNFKKLGTRILQQIRKSSIAKKMKFRTGNFKELSQQRISKNHFF